VWLGGHSISGLGAPPYFPLLLGIAAAFVHRFKGLQVGPLKGDGMTVALTVIIVLATFMWPIYSPPSAEMLLDREADRIMTLKDRTARDVALAKVSLEGLEILVERKWEPALAEQRHRAQRAAAAQQAAAAKLERANAKEVKFLVGLLSDMPKDWIENRRDAYSKLVKLAPGNPEYQRRYAIAIQDGILQEARDKDPASNIRIVRQGFRVGGFGVAYILDITLKNIGDRSWGNFTIKCRNLAASGFELEPTTGVLLDKLRAGQTRRFRHVVLGRLPQQVAKSGCQVTLADPL
jgi:hypothetical protein